MLRFAVRWKRTQQCKHLDSDPTCVALPVLLGNHISRDVYASYVCTALSSGLPDIIVLHSLNDGLHLPFY